MKQIDQILDEDMFADAGALDGVDANATKSLSDLVKHLRDKNEQIIQCEEYLKQLKAEKQRIATEQIPMLMDEMGIERVDVDGATVQLKPFVSASIPADRRQEAFAWLREHGLDEQKGFHPEKKTHIHAMTLKAFVKERVEKGLPIDLDMFGAYVARTADVKRNK
jgi:hypothetical protein